jgi:predicted nucleic acid-binding protein
MIIFDSTFLIDLLKSSKSKKHKDAEDLFQIIKDSGEYFAATFVNILELNKGVQKSANITASQKHLNILLRSLPILEFEEAYYKDYAILAAHLEKKGTPIGKSDELIAAIALNKRAKLVTNNAKDFRRIPKLEIIEY